MRKSLLFFALLGLLSCKKKDIAPTNGLIAYFPFSNNAADAGPNKFNVEIKGGVPSEDRNGNKLSAFYFNGVGEYLTVDHDTLLNIGTGAKKEISISLWFKADDTQPNNIAYSLIHKGFGESQYQDYHIFFNVNNKMAWSTGNSSDPCSQTVIENPEKNKWHHLVVTLSAKNKSKSIYIDNKLVKQCTYDVKAVANSQPLYIGAGVASGTSTPLFFKGSMDEIRFYNRVLTDKEISTLFKL